MEPRIQALKDPFFTADILDRFIRYVKIETTSDRHIEAIPSTACQWDLIRLLERELAEMGIRDIFLDTHGYLIARVPASPGLESAPCVGLMAHVDTASDVSAKNLEPRVHADYSGGIIVLEDGISIDPKDSTELREREGDTLITSNGRTLLGADDKAGLSEIMSAARYLQDHPELKHGRLELIFTPDEETGKGLDSFDAAWLSSAACYTMDSGGLGETESECFNAWRAKVTFSGKVIHIGAARGKLANAVAMAADFIQSLPRAESPEATDGWYGYYCAIEVKGSLESAECEVYLRDFTTEGMERRIENLKAIGKAVEAKFPGGSVSIDFQKQYLNMRERLEQHPLVLERLCRAVRENGVEPISKPIRGGTDGSRLTEMGIPTPNVFTGSYNMHSRREWASLSEMVLAARTIVSLVRLWAEG
jgi:tripeptide aminopeptidase